MIRRSVIAPVSHGGVGEHVLDVEDQRTAADQMRGPPGEPQRERRRHRDHSVDPTAAQRRQPGQRAEADEAGGPAHEVALVVAGERVDPGDRAPRGRLAPAPTGPPSPVRRRAGGTTAAP